MPQETRYWLDGLQLEAGGSATAFVPPALTPAEVALAKSEVGSRLDGLLAQRMEIWTRSLAQFSARPLTGWGPGQFQVAFDEGGYQYRYLPEGIFLAHAHNMLLEYLVALGVLGALPTLLVILVALWSLCTAGRFRPLSASAAGLLAALLGFQVFGLSDALAEGGRGALVLWAALGLAGAVVTRSNAAAAFMTRSPR